MRNGTAGTAVRVGLPALLCAAALAACGGTSSDNGTTSGAASTAGAASTSAAATSTAAGTLTAAGTSSSAGGSGVAHAQQVVARYSGTVNSYDTPTAPVKGLAGAKGKTVMYVPLIQAVPAFAITASGLQAALARVGMKLQICNGGGNPTQVAACITQGANQGDAGIVTDSIPYGMAANAFAAAKGKGVPVLITDQLPQPGTAIPGKVAYMPGNVDQPQLIADWIIADSHGSGNVIVGEEADNPSAIAYITQWLQPEFKRYCSGCTVKVIKIPLDPQQTASTVNAALTSTPSAQYYYGEFEDELQGAFQGIQQAGKISSLKVEFATATIAGLAKMKSGAAVQAEVGDDVNYQGWAAADEILRMIAHQPTVAEHIPERLLTRQNVGTITITPAAQASGVWYGDPNAFKAAFAKLWTK